MAQIPRHAHVLNYLQRDPLYEREKPYKFTYKVSELGVPATNLKFAAHSITPRKAEDFWHELRLDINGFQFLKWPTSLCASDFESDETITRCYYPEILEILRTIRPKVWHVDIISHSVGSR